MSKQNRAVYFVPIWEELIQDEPRLLTLYEKAKAITDDGSQRYFCANEYWYGYGLTHFGLKAELLPLVGWDRPKHTGYGYLRDEATYDLAYETIYAVLPSCRNCGCA